MTVSQCAIFNRVAASRPKALAMVLCKYSGAIAKLRLTLPPVDSFVERQYT